ncbi:MAG: DUF3526 domain-containing protein [Kordiimonadaceae bacterium]|nr:DUF3526 domain-containing protein [Kordiimonadaceae bacterium]MBO6567268.1 DUF3526 domain-containing protein [Kordiimonadaceae bacterium]MBO6963518.1 DUF3526 domain-containing protein [Kordiimonadaceae bacterium]
MIKAIIWKELLQYRRDGRILAVLLITLALGFAATLNSWSTVETQQRERQAAVASDRATWDNQGKKNPHSAAHFSRYAFQPTSSLSVFDPGLKDYMGSAIWLEAHYRDPATLRSVEDAVEIQRFARLTPAWILQVFAPLLAILLAFAGIAAERERGTLRQIMSSGVPPQHLFVGKAIAALCIVGLLAPSVIAAVALAANTHDEVGLPGTGGRLAGIVLSYILYIGAFTFAAIGISARVAKSKTALVVLVGFWAASVVFVPRLASDVGSALSPAPSAADFQARMSDDASGAFWGGSEEAQQRRADVEANVLKQYGVDKIEDLPINYDGYLLQESEEFANGVFDRYYDELWGTYEAQSDIVRLFSIVSPTLALSNISSALAGSDLFAHRHFADSAELFRRDFVKLLNEEMIQKGGQDGYGYMADNDFWQTNPDFTYTPPPLGAVMSNIWVDILVLLGWTFAALLLAFRGVRFSFKQEAVA